MPFLVFNLIITISYLIKAVFSLEDNRLISLDLRRIYGDFRLKLPLGLKEDNYTLVINQQYDYCYIFNALYNPELLYPKKTPLKELHSGKIYKDKVILNDNITLNIPMLIANGSFIQASSFTGGGFSFAFHYDNSTIDASILHRLFEYKLIDYLAYSFTQSEDNTGKMHLGGIPKEITQQKQVAQCKIPPNELRWMCIINDILIGDYHYGKKERVIFQALEKKIYAPYDYISYLINTVFAEEIKSRKCTVDLYRIIRCEKVVVDSLPDLHFTIDKYIITFKAFELFEMSFNSCFFLIAENIFKDNSTWIFGSFFMSYFDMLFDINAETISFYSNERISLLNTTTTNNNNNNDNDSPESYCNKTLLILYSLIDLLMIIGSGLLFFSKTKLILST